MVNYNLWSDVPKVDLGYAIANSIGNVGRSSEKGYPSSFFMVMLNGIAVDLPQMAGQTAQLRTNAFMFPVVDGQVPCAADGCVLPRRLNMFQN